MTAPTIDLSGFAPRQPFLDLPTPGFEQTYGVEICDIGEDGDMLILGHVGTLRAIAVFRARLRWLCDPAEADRQMHGLKYARDNVERLWAVQLTHCATYPNCADSEETPAGRCGDCREVDYHGFCIRWDATPETPGAFPVTLWRA